MIAYNIQKVDARGESQFMAQISKGKVRFHSCIRLISEVNFNFWPQPGIGKVR